MSFEIIQSASGEKIYVKKNIIFSGYRVVFPPKDENGKYNIPNLLFGGFSNLFKLIIILLLISAMMWSYAHDTAECKVLLSKTHEELCSGLSFNNSTLLPDGTPSNSWNKNIFPNLSS